MSDHKSLLWAGVGIAAFSGLMFVSQQNGERERAEYLAQKAQEEAKATQVSPVSEQKPEPTVAPYPSIGMDFTQWSNFTLPSGMEKTECSEIHNPILLRTPLANREAAQELRCFYQQVGRDHISSMYLYYYGQDLIAVQYMLDFANGIESVDQNGQIKTVVTWGDIQGLYTKKLGTRYTKKVWGDRSCLVGCNDFHFEHLQWSGAGNEAVLFEQQNLVGAQWIPAVRYVAYWNSALKVEALKQIAKALQKQKSDRKTAALEGKTP